MTCGKCSGLLRLDVDDHVQAVCCMNCGCRTYAPFVPFVISTERLEQAQWCKNCSMERVIPGRSLGPKCMGARIKQGQATGKLMYVRRQDAPTLCSTHEAAHSPHAGMPD